MTSELDEPRATPDDDAPDQGSLADRLAAWTPPWSRPEPAPTDPAREQPPAPADDPADPAPVAPEPAENAPEPEPEAAGHELPSVPVEDAQAPGEPVPDGSAEGAGEFVPVEDAEVLGEPVPDGSAEGAGEFVPVEDAEVLGGPVPDESAEDAGESVPVEDVEVPGGPVPDEPAEDAGESVPVEEAEVPGEPEPAGDAAVAGDPGTGEAGELPELDDPVLLRGAVEAMLMVVDEPVAEHVLAEAVQRPVDVVTAVLRELADEYTAQRRGFELRRAAGGWRIYTRDDFAGYVERFVLEGQQVRLTQAALETLAVVAYKQPVSRSRVSAIRGVNCDGVIRTLLTRGLIEECGTEPESGAHLYRTSMLFLERMGINSVEELPELAPFLPDDLPEEA